MNDLRGMLGEEFEVGFHRHCREADKALGLTRKGMITFTLDKLNPTDDDIKAFVAEVKNKVENLKIRE